MKETKIKFILKPYSMANKFKLNYLRVKLYFYYNNEFYNTFW